MALEAIISWGGKRNLRINLEKTKLMICRGPYSRPTFLESQVELSSGKIDVVARHKLLGCVIDDKLNGADERGTVKRKIYKRLSVLAKVASKEWGAAQQTLLDLYKVYVRPCIEYCFAENCFWADSSLRYIQACENSALRLATGCLRRTRIADLRALCDIEGIKTRLAIRVGTFAEEQIRQYPSRVVRKALEAERKTRSWKQRNALIGTVSTDKKTWIGMTNEVLSLVDEETARKPKRREDRLSPIELARAQKTAEVVTTEGNGREETGEIYIYTDGSRKDGIGGWGAVARRNGAKVWAERQGLGKTWSSYQEHY